MHPFDALVATAAFELTRGPRLVPMRLYLVPKIVEPQIGEARHADDGNAPPPAGGRENVQRRLVFGGGRFGAARVLAIGFVHRDDIGELEHALLDALELVPSTCEHQRDEDVGEVGDRSLGLPDPDRFDDDDVEAHGLA